MLHVDSKLMNVPTEVLDRVVEFSCWLLKVLVALTSQKEDLAIDFDPSVIHATQAMFMIIILLNYLIAVISHEVWRISTVVADEGD